MKVVNDGQEISNRLTIIILEKKKCLSENHLSDTPPCHHSIKTIHFTRCIAYQPMSALVDNEGTFCGRLSMLVVVFISWLLSQFWSNLCDLFRFG